MTARLAAARLKDPRYIGTNRCTPCTVVNLCLAAVAAFVVAIAVQPLFGVALLLASLAVLYFRGYVVPGTPTLTKRYLPERVLRWFGKAPDRAANPRATDGRPVDVEAVLTRVGVFEPASDGSDLRLTANFRTAWDRWTRRLADAEQKRVLAALAGPENFPVDEAPAIVEEDVSVAVTVGDYTVGRWPSSAALLADAAAAAELGIRDPNWDARTFDKRTQLLAGVRLCLDRCPDCDGAPSLDERHVESCCYVTDVVAVTCDDCGARLFEVELPSSDRS